VHSPYNGFQSSRPIIPLFLYSNIPIEEKPLGFHCPYKKPKDCLFIDTAENKSRPFGNAEVSQSTIDVQGIQVMLESSRHNCETFFIVKSLIDLLLRVKGKNGENGKIFLGGGKKPSPC